MLRVTGAPAGLELWRGEERLANGRRRRECRFRGLPRGQYSLKAGGKEWEVLVNGDAAMDLAGKAATSGAHEGNLGPADSSSWLHKHGGNPGGNCAYTQDL